ARARVGRLRGDLTELGGRHRPASVGQRRGQPVDRRGECTPLRLRTEEREVDRREPPGPGGGYVEEAEPERELRGSVARELGEGGGGGRGGGPAHRPRPPETGAPAG